MNVRLQNVELFVSIVYIVRFGAVTVLAKKVPFLTDIPDNGFRSEIRSA
jgi:hypothetical protein